MEFVELFRWVCLALFFGAGVIWLLDVAGPLTIRDASQRKILNAALGTTLVGGMASFAATEFFASAPDEPARRDPPIAIASGTATPPPSRPPPGASGTSLPDEPVEPVPDPGVQPQATEPGLPAEVSAFLAAKGLRRPVIESGWEASYPGCAREARSAPLDRLAARACFRALDGFNRAVLTPYQDAYDAYVPQVAQLSYAQPAGAVLDFLRKEAAEFTQGTNAAAALYRTISSELDADFARLRRQAYS